MGKAIDITGQRFGRLIALKPTENRSSKGSIMWLCKCDCGTIKEISIANLRNKRTKSCGCLARELTSKRQSESGYNLTGKRFGRLKVIKAVGKRKNDGRIWLCKCDCGNTTEVSARTLVSGHTRSCGCLQIEHITRLGLSNKGKNNPAYNHDLTDEERSKNKFQRGSDEAKKARIETYKRDNYTCNICGSKGGDLHAHHLDSFADNIDKRFDLDNLITLCAECHKDFHKTYGYGNNTKEQFEDYKEFKKIT